MANSLCVAFSRGVANPHSLSFQKNPQQAGESVGHWQFQHQWGNVFPRDNDRAALKEAREAALKVHRRAVESGTYDPNRQLPDPHRALCEEGMRIPEPLCFECERCVCVLRGARAAGVRVCGLALVSICGCFCLLAPDQRSRVNTPHLLHHFMMDCPACTPLLRVRAGGSGGKS